tara:strand:+ start:1258 stop:2283 length:1026 start_codon:yes stop_codon:yes gene_type:complete
MTKDISTKVKEYFRSSDLAKLSDFIFSETIPSEEFDKIKSKHFVIHRNLQTVTYINQSFSLADDYIIFSKTDYVSVLFKQLKKSTIKNLTLITHQSDKEIGNHLYNKKPDAVKYWFSVNVTIEKPDLIPIPIGFANSHYEKNLNPENFTKQKINTTRDNLIYLNFNPNTNYLEREMIFKKYKKNKSFFISPYNSSISNYKNDLERFKFVLCPPGNGIQTHRLWESLYFGAIPILKNHIFNKNFKKLNAIFVDDFTDLKIKELDDKIVNKEFDYRDIFKEYYDRIFSTNKLKNKNNIYKYKISNLSLGLITLKFKSITLFNKFFKPIRSKFYKLIFLFLGRD